MTVERVYQCNLCNSRCEPDELTGIYWTGDGPGTIEFRSARNVEHHICQDCLGSIVSLVANNKPGEETF